MRLLRGTGWSHYPRAEWQDDPPRQWSIAVFPDHSEPQATAPGTHTVTGRQSAPPGGG
jgi:hypothetical protein